MSRTKISPKLTRDLRALATPVFKQKGTILFRAGYPARGAFLVRQGRVRLALDQAVELYPTRILGSGSVIGLPATFSGEPYSLTAEAAEDCNLDFIPRRKILNLLRRKPKIGRSPLQNKLITLFISQSSCGTKKSCNKGI
jgi:CRP-like cAMP-binding protein